MNGQHNFPVLKADTQHGTERRRSPRYRCSEAMAVQCPGGTLHRPESASKSAKAACPRW